MNSTPTKCTAHFAALVTSGPWPSREGSTTVKCPLCDAEYWVKGGYVPHYTSAFSEEELEFES